MFGKKKLNPVISNQIELASLLCYLIEQVTGKIPTARMRNESGEIKKVKAWIAIHDPKK